MVKWVKVKYRGGVLEPLEPLGLEEGAELTVMIPALGEASGTDESITATAGAWADLTGGYQHPLAGGALRRCVPRSRAAGS